MTEAELRDLLVERSASLYQRGFSVGSAGNISAAVEDGFLITPTNSSLGFLDPQRISKLDRNFKHIAGDPPSKEVFLHRAFYETVARAGAVVHLHSTYATALSCLEGIDRDDAVPPLTPYVVMRVGQVKLIPYVRPGDPRMGDMIRALGGKYTAVLLANHGPVVAGPDLLSAIYAAEELEETAKLVVTLADRHSRLLTREQIDELVAVFRK
ncbi:3-oxo-tetronate 4-phosphate decarboxylase [Taklimakanibacter deserti]|uniref:3-oxo-tetronate 4-phosphate decarboxylase n=1 Tax=Taklimakanibacter deserti TaxID=2267839 RepID=UPI000E65CBCC